ERVFVVSKKQLTSEAIWVPEKAYPFDMADVGTELFHGKQEWLQRRFCRTGWYLQQLLKLYAPVAIPDLSEYFLIVDSDIVFYRDVELFCQGVPCYGTSHENWRPYFDHMAKLLPGLRRFSDVSGIVHHMLMSRSVLDRLKQEVETLWHRPFWKSFLGLVEPGEGCGASEYEIYFNYLQLRGYPIKLKPTSWIQRYVEQGQEEGFQGLWDFVVYEKTSPGLGWPACVE
ncbi:MAG: DUF6492 family protein, partial [Chlamydiia bacterium]